MIKEAIVLLMWFGSPLELMEFSVRDGLSECLKAKRTITRNVKSPGAKAYRGTMRMACKKFKVEVDKNGNIVNFIGIDKSKLKPF